MHVDKVAAMDTIRRLRELEKIEGVHLALAHVDINELDDEMLKKMLI